MTKTIRAALALAALVSGEAAHAQEGDMCIAARSIVSYLPDHLNQIGGAKDQDGDLVGTIKFPLALRCWVGKKKPIYTCVFHLPAAQADSQTQALANVIDGCFPNTAGTRRPDYYSWRIGENRVHLSRTDVAGDDTRLFLVFGDSR